MSERPRAQRNSIFGSPRLMSIGRESDFKMLMAPQRPFLRILPSVAELHPEVEKALQLAFQEYNREGNRVILFTAFDLPKFNHQKSGRRESKVSLPAINDTRSLIK
eukprot:TRINITY_DN4370_c0_g1_i4.p2 TRINITY_DN4370_c0_g1~~TRINITY_DN4370_c0_g1_i4.p2  ORF type:complete len:106 (+),score=20.64 TRINITY_DN4370_c0_g1_i4:575-892(+)